MVDTLRDSAIARPCAAKAMALRKALLATTGAVFVSAAFMQSSVLVADAAPSPPAPCGTLVCIGLILCCQKPAGIVSRPSSRRSQGCKCEPAAAGLDFQAHPALFPR